MIRAIIIVEMAGMPAEHVKESLAKHMEHLKEFSYVTEHSVTVSEPKEIDGSKGVFTCFAEADFEADTFENMTRVIFDFMPSSVEILEPSNINLSSKDTTDLLNNISGRLHRYDQVAKIAQMKIRELSKKLEEAGVENGEEKVEPKVKKVKKRAKKKVKK